MQEEVEDKTVALAIRPKECPDMFCRLHHGACHEYGENSEDDYGEIKSIVRLFSFQH